MTEPYEVSIADKLFLISLLVNLAYQTEETLDRFGGEIQEIIHEVTKYNGRHFPNEDLYHFLCLNFKNDHIVWVFVDAYPYIEGKQQEIENV